MKILNENGYINFNKYVEYARYSDLLEEVIDSLGGKEILRCKYDSDYQGFVDVDVLLNDGRVFSYYYSYGSCDYCDQWEGEGYNYQEIKNEMLKECSIFDNIDFYNEWRNSVKE